MQKCFVLPSIINLDDLFSRTPNTTVFNEIMLECQSSEVVDILCDISNDKTDSVASCECGCLKGNYYTGTKCRVCNTVCESNLFGEIRNDSWLAIPNSIKGVLNPQVFRILESWMGNTTGHQPIIRQILDMQLPIEPIPNTPFYSGMGFNWFYDNFDAVITYFLTSHPTDTGRKAASSIELFLKQAGNAVWCHYLPILSKIVQPITRVNKDVRYADTDIKNLMKSIFTLRSILLAEKTMKFSYDHIDRNFFNVYIEFINYTKNILYSKLPRKQSILRKHVFGSRSHCSGRTVAIPIVEPHESDNIHLPWRLGLMMYRYHVLAVLVKKFRIPPLKAFNRVVNAINVYDYEIDRIMQKLIEECPYKGFPLLVNRNPSLKIASIQLLFATKIKPSLTENPVNLPNIEDINVSVFDQDDEGFNKSSSFIDINVEDQVDPKLKYLLRSYVEDDTIAVSPLIVKGPNLDLRYIRSAME